MNMAEKTAKLIAQVELQYGMSDNHIPKCFGFADGFWAAIATIRGLREFCPGLKPSLSMLEEILKRNAGSALKGYVDFLTSK